MGAFETTIATAGVDRYVLVRVPDESLKDEFRLGHIAADAERQFQGCVAIIVGAPSGAMFGHPKRLAALKDFDPGRAAWRAWRTDR